MQPAAANFDFSIVHITDTQNLCDDWVRDYEDPSIIQYLSNLTQWITSNVQTYNIQMVIHTGDLVNWPPDDEDQWTATNDAFMTFYNNGVPYSWCARQP
jgi:hypothetical protein